MGSSSILNVKFVGKRIVGRLTVAFALTLLLLAFSIQLPMCAYSPLDLPVPSESPERNEKRDFDSPAAPFLTTAVLSGDMNEDVTVSWTLSADDGAGDGDVSHYAVYTSGVYDYEGDGYSYLGQVGSGETSFTHILAGDGDWSDQFYYVQANDTSGNGNWSGQAGKFVRFLEKGKHLASVPLVQEDTTLEVVLQSLAGSFKHVRYYKSSDQSDHWKTYWTFKTYRTLFDIDHRMGFWIDMTKDDHLVVAGLVPEATQIELGHNWNLVGYPSFIDRTVSDALAGIDWKKVQGWGASPPYHQRQMSGSDIMTAGEGYWIWVDLPQVWEVSDMPIDPPYIMDTYPADGAIGVPLDASIFVKFSKEMDIPSVAWLMSPDPGPYGVTWSEGNTLIEIRYDRPWQENQTVTIRVYGKDLDGNSLVPGPVPNPWSFTTYSEPPFITETLPLDGSLDVSLTAPIIVHFSEPMDVATFTWTIVPDPSPGDPGGPDGWLVSWTNMNQTVTLVHDLPFDENMLYEVTVTSARDEAGNHLVPGPVPNPWSFWTVQIGNPYIISTDPYDGEYLVPVNRSISIRFSESMNRTSLHWTVVPDPGGWVHDWFDNDTLVVLAHSNPFDECTQYTVKVLAAEDLSGKPLVQGPAPNPWSFITISTCPYVVNTYPTNNQTNVSIWQAIWIEFSWSMNWTSMIWDIDPDPGGWNVIWPGDVSIYFDHSNPFQTNTTYVFQILYIEDIYGVPLCKLPFTLTFTTGW